MASTLEEHAATVEEEIVSNETVDMEPSVNESLSRVCDIEPVENTMPPENTFEVTDESGSSGPTQTSDHGYYAKKSVKRTSKTTKKAPRPTINTNNIYISVGYDHDYCHSIKKNAIVSDKEKKVKDKLIHDGLRAVIRNTEKKKISPETKRKLVAASRSRIVALMGYWDFISKHNAS